MPKTYFNPGCAVSIYDPGLEIKVLKILNDLYGPVALHNICCRHDPQLPASSLIINACPGCDRRFSRLYEGLSTVTVWEVLDGLKGLPLPDYQGLKISIHDPCPVREKPQVHKAVRSLLRKMKIEVKEAVYSGTRSVCCGDSFFNKLAPEQVRAKMEARASSMPCDEVCVYCISCVKSMFIGGRTPRHLLDLILGRATDPQILDTAQWHEQLQSYIDSHQG